MGLSLVQIVQHADAAEAEGGREHGKDQQQDAKRDPDHRGQDGVEQGDRGKKCGDQVDHGDEQQGEQQKQRREGGLQQKDRHEVAQMAPAAQTGAAP